MRVAAAVFMLACATVACRPKPHSAVSIYPALQALVPANTTFAVGADPERLRWAIGVAREARTAAGLDPERCIFFRQSDVREHTELTWLLSSVTAFGDLNRMHQFKDKSSSQRELASAGLFFYPVLMASDVLAYRAHEVPVGEDQRQHVELMRDVAERFNARFGDTLVVPEHRIPEVGARVRDLQEPERKMSTTGGTAQGTVYVLDEPDAIVRKFKRALPSDLEERYRVQIEMIKTVANRKERYVIVGTVLFGIVSLVGLLVFALARQGH